jgi:hypothetical protein
MVEKNGLKNGGIRPVFWKWKYKDDVRVVVDTFLIPFPRIWQLADGDLVPFTNLFNKKKTIAFPKSPVNRLLKFYLVLCLRKRILGFFNRSTAHKANFGTRLYLMILPVIVFEGRGGGGLELISTTAKKSFFVSIPIQWYSWMIQSRYLCLQVKQYYFIFLWD